MSTDSFRITCTIYEACFRHF